MSVVLKLETGNAAVRSSDKISTRSHKRSGNQPVNTALADALMKVEGNTVMAEFKERKFLTKEVIRLTKDVFRLLGRTYVIGAMYRNLNHLQWHADLHQLIRDLKNAAISSGSYVRAYETLTGQTCKKVPSVVYRNMNYYRY